MSGRAGGKNAPASLAPPDETKKIFGSVAVPTFVLTITGLALQVLTFLWAVMKAYDIRTYALTEYGYVIHEFDPWFNYRATEYLARHGWHAFFHWFDYMSWYPIGRPVGTTIYPGLQITSVAIYRVLKWLGKPYRMTLNDICCTLPCWGGAAATLFLALLTYEATNSRTAAAIAAVVMAIIPAHIMRSVGGGYDNECLAMTAMLMTFYFWVRSLRTPSSWPIGIIAGLAYGYMVAAWGGYIFVLNMVALHALISSLTDWIHNKYDHNLFRAYCLFFIVGTAIATTVPPVGMTPFKSLEQLLGLCVFIFYCTIYASERARVAMRDVPEIRSARCNALRLRYLGGVGVVLMVIAVLLWPTGFFGPLSSRVRGLFLRHTRTGNPLVDSVAEHRPASQNAYWQYLHYGIFGWIGGAFLFAIVLKERPRASIFMVIYCVVVAYFSGKMSRLLILTGPVASAGTGALLGSTIDWIIAQFYFDPEEEVINQSAPEKTKSGGKKQVQPSYLETLKQQYQSHPSARMAVAVAVAAILVCLAPSYWESFQNHSESLAYAFSSPKIMFKSRDNFGRTIIIDDYREAYHWLRDKTPQDSRVMAWWDYGYQITGIGNRTSIADGNTWNHEHIATLGKCLTSPVKEAHSLIRHLADYVLVWAGGGGDDLAKSPHMARIGNSVYHDICPLDDPLCTHFGFHGANHDKPTPTMRASLLYNLHAHNMRPGVRVDPNLFSEAFKSKYGLVRIFKVMNVSQESKDWLADPKNRVCDAPGSWYCVGQYPPAKEIQDLLKRKTDFAQLEDFNRRKDKKDSEYYKRYMQRMAQMGG